MKVDTKALALHLFEQGVVTAQPDVASGRTKFWANFGPRRPTQVIVTDGAIKQHPNPDNIGVMEYKLADDATYVLVVEHDADSRHWIIIYAYFCHKHRLNTKKLKAELRTFHPHNLTPRELEQALSALSHD